MENFEQYNHSNNELIGEDQNPFIPQEQKDGTDDTVKEGHKNKTISGIKTAILMIGLFLASEKGADYISIKHNLNKLSIEKVNMLSLEEKIIRIKELFGNNVNLIRYEILEKNLNTKISSLNHSLAEFPFDNFLGQSPVVMDVLDSRYDRDQDQSQLKTSDSIEFADYKFVPVKNENGLIESNVEEPTIINEKVSYKKFMEVLTNEIFPKGAIKGEVRCIIQKPTTEGTINKDYYNNHVNNDVYAVADCTTYLVKENVITLYRESTKMQLMELLLDIAHEVGHANDWNSDNALSTEERSDLLLAVADRVRSKDRYISGYVESIENDDKKIELYNKSVEYWAEIYSMYIIRPSELNYKDFKIVDELVKKSDPEFQARLFLDQQKMLNNSMNKIKHDN